MYEVDYEYQTLPELAKLLGLKETGRQLSRTFRHLQEEHGLELSKRDREQTGRLQQAQEALDECQDSCGAGIEVHIDLTTLIPDHIPTHKEKIAAAKSAGLIGKEDVLALCRKVMIKRTDLKNDDKRFAEMTRLNLQPAMTFIGPKDRQYAYYDPAVVREILNRWKALYGGIKPARPKITVHLADVLRELDGVTRKHILDHFGVHPANQGAGAYLMRRLQAAGLTPIRPFGNTHIFSKAAVDAAAEIAELKPKKTWV